VHYLVVETVFLRDATVIHWIHWHFL